MEIRFPVWKSEEKQSMALLTHLLPLGLRLWGFLAVISPSFFQLGSDTSCLQPVTPGDLSCSSQVCAWCKTLWHCSISSSASQESCRDIPLSQGSPATLLIGLIRILPYKFPVNEAAPCQLLVQSCFSKAAQPWGCYPGLFFPVFSC